jgi:hypothetical protein
MRKYESMSELVEAAGRTLDADEAATYTRDAYFAGRSLVGWAEVAAAVNGVRAEEAGEVERMAGELAALDLPRPTDRKRRTRWSEDGGDEIDHDRLRSGQLDCWRQQRRESCQAPQHVVVVCQIGALQSVPARDLLWRGAAAIALADLLEQAGYRVTLWACGRSVMNTFSRRPGGEVQYSVRACRLKASDEPVNAAALANAVCGWMYRLVWLQEHAVERPGWAHGGRTVPLLPEDVEELADGQPVLVIQDIYDREAAVKKAGEAVVALAG